MNRISRRTAAEAADALLEAGRTEPVLDYDVELGLERHHDWLRSEAPLPEWASTGVGIAAKSSVAVFIKTIVSAVLLGALAVAGWQARGLLQPSAANVTASVPALPRVENVPAFEPEPEPAIAPRPIPVPDHSVINDEVVSKRRTVRADKHATHAARAHKEIAAPPAEAAAAAPVEVAAPAPSENVNVARATRNEAEARKPVSAAQKAQPEPRREAQSPDDLVEMQQVATAEQLLERSPARALALVHKGDQQFGHGYFQQERAYIAIMALIRLDRLDQTRARAASFAKQYPPLPYGARIRSALEARGARVE
jgi:hypothetical protein